MALTFPLSVADFADKLKIQSVEWKLQRYDELSGLGTGAVLSAQLAPPRWTAKVNLAPMLNGEAFQVQALIEVLDPMASFYLYAPQQPYPQSDPDGSILGASTPAVRTVGSDNKSFSLKGLPVGYVISVGDMIAFDYGSNPTRRALHRVMETQVATAGGNTVLFEVRPHLRPGIAIDLPVTLIKPAAKMLIVPGSFSPGTSIGTSGLKIASGMAFEAVQRP